MNGPAPLAARRRWLTILVALIFAEVTTSFEVGMMYGALATLIREFKDPVGAGWLITAFLLVGAVDVFAGEGLVVRRFSAPMLISVVSLVVLGSLRSLALLRRTGRATSREAVGALGMWLSLGWVVALASVRGLVAREGAFLRTPKVRGDVGWRDSLRGNLVESALAVTCLAGAVLGGLAAASGAASGAIVALLLLVQGLGYAAAPLNSLAAARADMTPEQRRRRREKLLSWSGVTPAVRRWGFGPVLAAGATAAVVLLFAGPVGAPRLDQVPGHAGAQSSGSRTSLHHRVADRAATQSQRPTLPALSPAATSAGAGTPSNQPSTGTTTRPTPTTRPTRAPTTPAAQQTTRPTAQPTQATTAHGRPTSLPTKTAPTKKPH